MRSWVRALTHPGIPTYQGEVPRAGARRLAVSVALGSLVVGGFILLDGLLTGGLDLTLAIAVSTPAISFFLVAVALQGAAYLFGGDGTFPALAWVLSICWFPLQILSYSPLGWVHPYGVAPVPLAALLYQFFLIYLILRAVHSLTPNRAYWGVVIAILLQIALGQLLNVVAGALAGAFGVPLR